MTLFTISGGTVYDPKNGIAGEIRDIWIEEGRIVAAPADAGRQADRVLNAEGLVVMPGGVDMHCHIAGPKANTARKIMPAANRRPEKEARTPPTPPGTVGSVP